MSGTERVAKTVPTLSVRIGPVPSWSVLAWVHSARETLAALHRDTRLGVPPDVVEQFTHLVDTWETHARASAEFHWSGSFAPSDVRRLGSYWALVADVARDLDHPEMQPATAAAEPFYNALVTAVGDVLAHDETADDFQGKFREVVPEFVARRGGHQDSRSPIRIVVVDDAEDIRLLFRIALQADPRFEVVAEAAGGRQGLDAASRTHPDVVLLDVRMPEMDGWTALPLIRERCPATHVVLITAQPSNDLRAAALSLGADDVLDKQASIDGIKRALVAAARSDVRS